MSIPVKAVIAIPFTVSPGVVLFHDGGPLEYEIDAVGNNIEEIGFPIHQPPGIWVWEGKWIPPTENCEGVCDDGPELRGKYRAPTDAEWQAIREGRSPW